jgi:hypothetical protein
LKKTHEMAGGSIGQSGGTPLLAISRTKPAAGQFAQSTTELANGDGAAGSKSGGLSETGLAFGGGATMPPAPPAGTADPAAPAEAQITATYGARFTPAGQPAGYQLAGGTPVPQAKKWEPNEVDTVDRAFKAIPKEDKGVLQDITLSRVKDLPDGGDTLAEFQDAEDSQAGTVTRTILVTDGNFSAQRGQTLSNDEPARSIVHEVGHALAHNARDKAELADVKAIQAIMDAQAEYKKAEAEHDAWKKQQGSEPTDTAGILRRDKAEEPYAKAQLAAWHRVEAAQDARKQTEKAVEDSKVPKEIVDAGQARQDSIAAQADGESTRVESDISKMSPEQLKSSKDYRTTSSSVTSFLRTYSDMIRAGKVGLGSDQKSPDDWDKDVAFMFNGRDDNRKELEGRDRNNPALKILAPVDRTADSWRKEVQTQARLRERVPKVQEFVDLVNQVPSIDPGTVSPYAAKSWPHKPEEFFAECYSLWRMNPEQKLDMKPKPLPPRIFQWFDRGSYR